MKVEVAVLGSPSLIVLMVSVDVEKHYLLSEFRSCVKVEVAVLGSPSLTVLMVSVDVEKHYLLSEFRSCVKVPNSPYGLCGRKATLN